jgi:hypothetical protein
MISRLRRAQETMLVRLTARCQGGSIAAPIIEPIRDGIERLAGTRRLTAHAAQPSALAFAAPGLFRCRQPRPAASPFRHPLDPRDVPIGGRKLPGAGHRQRFKLSARERTTRESRGYATDAAMGARTGGIWATLARGGAGDRLAKAKSASAAPTLTTTAALIGRTE